MRIPAILVFPIVVGAIGFGPAAAQADKPTPVNVHNFVRAETDLYFAKAAIDDGAFGKLRHRRAMADVDKQGCGADES